MRVTSMLLNRFQGSRVLLGYVLIFLPRCHMDASARGKVTQGLLPTGNDALAVELINVPVMWTNDARERSRGGATRQAAAIRSSSFDQVDDRLQFDGERFSFDGEQLSFDGERPLVRW